MAALLHDVGHGPFSHSLENELVDVPHEYLSKLIMERLNIELEGKLEKALQIFDHSYPLRFLHQLVSSQLDVDRMDYLNRDSYYTGVSEGVIGYDRILQMLTVRDNELAVEEKGVHSVEKFIIARRLMYWQVYLHNTVLGAELLLINILKRARELAGEGQDLFATPTLRYFLYHKIDREAFASDPRNLEWFCRLDDSDIMVSIKEWQFHEDATLATLSKMLILRKLYKVALSSDSLARYLEEKVEETSKRLSIDPSLMPYFVFGGRTSINSYKINEELINIETKSGILKNITEIDDSLVSHTLTGAVYKNYVCFVPELVF
jgi:HD superfamily phosphohydrolase